MLSLHNSRNDCQGCSSHASSLIATATLAWAFRQGEGRYGGSGRSLYQPGLVSFSIEIGSTKMDPIIKVERWTQRVLTPTLGGGQPGDRHNMSQYACHTLLLHHQHNLAHLHLPFVHQGNEVHLFGSRYINPCRALILCQIVCVCMSDSDSLDGFPCFWPCLFSSWSCPGKLLILLFDQVSAVHCLFRSAWFLLILEGHLLWGLSTCGIISWICWTRCSLNRDCLLIKFLHWQSSCFWGWAAYTEVK